MKFNSTIAILFAALVVFACGQDTSTLEGKKAALAQAKADMKELESTIGDLEKEIKAEDPTFGKAEVRSTLVTTVPANKTEFHHKIEVRGNVESRTNVYISSEAMGQIVNLNVIEGQSVRRGQVIAKIDSENLEKSISEVQTQLDYATTVYQKRARLWEKNIGTEIDYLQSKNQKEALEKQLETLQTQLEKTNIKAPFTGTIEEVPVKQGEFVQPGSRVAFLVSNTDMYINADVSETYIGKLNVGDSVDVQLPSLGSEFKSVITSVGNVINAASRTFTVEVKLPKKEDYLKTNLVALVHMVDYSANDAIVIPSRIIQEDLDGNFVYLLEKGSNKATKVHVKLGYSYNNETEVVAGLSGGESVVDKGNRTIADGTVVKVQN